MRWLLREQYEVGKHDLGVLDVGIHNWKTARKVYKLKSHWLFWKINLQYRYLYVGQIRPGEKEEGLSEINERQIL